MTTSDRTPQGIATTLMRDYWVGMGVEMDTPLSDDDERLRDRITAALTAEREARERDAVVVAQAHAMIDAAGFLAGPLPARVEVLLSELHRNRKCAERHACERDTAIERAEQAERERDEARERIPYPWCHECQAECQRVDEDGLCMACGTEPEFPTALTVRDRAVLRAECQAGRQLTGALEWLGGRSSDPLEDARAVEALHGNYTAHQYLAARRAQIATDVAGAMGEVSDGE